MFGATLRNSADVRTLCLVAFYFFLVAVCWNFEDQVGWFIIPLVLATCWWSFIGAATTHNTMHCKVFKERWANKVWQLILTLTYGHPVSSYVPGHNLSHHRFTQLKKDIMRTQKLRWKCNFFNLIFFQPTVAGDVLKSDLKFLRLQHVLKRPFIIQASRELAFLALVMASLAYMDWRKFLLYFHLPHLFGQWGIVTMNLLQHDGCDIVPEGSTEPNYNHARNFVGGMLNWLTMNNGYHTVHHMNPTMHWSKYPEAHEKLVKPHIHPALDQRNMVTYIFKACIYPGIRETYDKKPVDLSNGLDPDEDWMEYPDGVGPKDVQLSAGRIFGMFGRGVGLAFGKLICPIWSPFVKLA